MTLWDMMILAALVLGMLAGWSSGFVRQVVGLAGVVVGILVGVALMNTVGSLLAPIFGLSDTASAVIGFGVLFVGVQILAASIARVLRGIVAALRLSLLNRAGGGLVGLAKAAIIVSLVLLVADQGGFPAQEARAESSLYEPIAGVVPELWEYLRAVFPEMVDLAEKFGERVIEEVQEP